MDVYLVAEVRSVHLPAAMPGGVKTRSIERSDVPALAALYMSAYLQTLTQTINEAVAEMESAFDGTWGQLWNEASPAAWVGEEPIAVVQTVRRASWEGAPDLPWIIEAFTAPRHRRLGVARSLLAATCRVLEAGGERSVGLTVDQTNIPAVTLYRSLGFEKKL